MTACEDLIFPRGSQTQALETPGEQGVLVLQARMALGAADPQCVGEGVPADCSD